MKIDFYLLNDSDPDASLLFACRLLEKAYLRGHRVFVYCSNHDDAIRIDEYLWTFKDDSFVPHNLQGEGPMPPPAVQIGFDAEPRGFNDILLNMSAIIPPFYARFRRIMQVVAAEESAKEISRMQYKAYRKLGFKIETHEILASTVSL